MKLYRFWKEKIMYYTEFGSSNAGITLSIKLNISDIDKTLKRKVRRTICKFNEYAYEILKLDNKEVKQEILRIFYENKNQYLNSLLNFYDDSDNNFFVITLTKNVLYSNYNNFRKMLKND